MNSLALELFVGPAVVVDDEVDTGARALVDQLKEARFPVLQRKTIPPDEELAHWQAMSLIVLDWDLLGGPLGVAVPDSVRRHPRTDSLRFVRKLMDKLYCPIFIISNVPVRDIWRQLEKGLDAHEFRQLKARVLVRSKIQVEGGLLGELTQWIGKHPVIYALKTWERGYERAKTALFKDFQLSAVEWPGILWRTSYMDGVNPNHDLTETISRNLLHRMDPNLFSEDLILSKADGESPSSTDNRESLESVRRVLHQHAVLPVERLHSDVTMPGDFFWENEEQHPPPAIDICLTPACDLVARGQKVDDVQMFMVRAALVGDDELKNRKAIKHTLRSSDMTTSVLLHHLVMEDAMYRVKFKDWFVTTWGEVKDKRRGRLLDPYVTLLQQRNALFSQRQGLPRLPKNFYRPRDSSD